MLEHGMQRKVKRKFLNIGLEEGEEERVSEHEV